MWLNVQPVASVWRVYIECGCMRVFFCWLLLVVVVVFVQANSQQYTRTHVHNLLAGWLDALVLVSTLSLSLPLSGNCDNAAACDVCDDDNTDRGTKTRSLWLRTEMDGWDGSISTRTAGWQQQRQQ